MFSYTTYGLNIRSALPLPELVAGEAGQQVVVRLGSVGGWPSETAGREPHFRVTAEEAYLSWREVGTFLVRGGREIIVDPAPSLEENFLRLFILGPALAVLLHQRGILVLHASALSINDSAVVFLGGPGWGKSTVAAALHTRGHGVVADDVVAVQLDGEGPTVLPGFPRLKLWPDAVVALGGDLEILPRLHLRIEKRACCVPGAFPQVPLSLRCIYVLAEGKIQEIEPLGPQEAFVELVRHSYCVRLLHASGASSHFRQCAKVAQSSTIRRLRRPKFLSALPGLARLVEEDLV